MPSVCEFNVYNNNNLFKINHFKLHSPKYFFNQRSKIQPGTGGHTPQGQILWSIVWNIQKIEHVWDKF